MTIKMPSTVPRDQRPAVSGGFKLRDKIVHDVNGFRSQTTTSYYLKTNNAILTSVE